MATSDEDIVASFLAGEPTTVEEIENWIRQCAATFRRRAGDQWEDLLLDARLEILRLLTAGRFRGQSSLKTYVWRVVMNSCVDTLRWKRREEWRRLGLASEGPGGRDEPSSQVVSEAKQRELVEQLLSQMSDGCRALWKSLFEGHSYQELSRRHGISEATVRTRLLLCRSQALTLRQELLQVVPSLADDGTPSPHPSTPANEDPFSSIALSRPGEQLLDPLSVTHDPIVPRALQVCNERLLDWLKRHPEDLDRLHPGTFEQIVAEIFQSEGFDVELISSWNQADGGVDLIAVRRLLPARTLRLAIQCKKNAKARRVTAEPVRALAGVLDHFHAHLGVVATTSYFTDSAVEETRKYFWKIALRDYDNLVEALQRMGSYELSPGGLWIPPDREE